MNYKQKYNNDLSVSLWFIPLIMCLSSVFLAYGILYLDLSANLNTLKEQMSILIGPESFTQLLSVSSTSVITIVTITFSISILTLSIASNQLGPRLLPSFLDKRVTQFSLGYLIGTFIFNIIILQSTSAEKIFSYPPVLSASLAFILSIFSLVVFIFFIHFSSRVIQVDNALESLSNGLINTINSNNAKSNSDNVQYQSISDSSFYKVFDRLPYKEMITDQRSGYLQLIHYKKIFEIASQQELKIDVLVKPGDFCFQDRPLMIVKSQKKISEQTLKNINSHIYFGKRRTTDQDIEFGFELLVEVALRALSPGVNNPYTAIHCLDRISEGLVAVTKISLEKGFICNQKMEPIIQRKTTTYQSITNIALNQIRQKAKGDIAVTIYMLQMLKGILKLDGLPEELIKELQIQSKRIYENSKLSDMIDDDRDDIQFHFDQIKQSSNNKGVL